MKRTIVFCGIALAATASVFVLPAKAAKVVNRSLATVNGEAILLSEFEKNWESFLEQQKDMIPPDQMTPQWKADVRKKILNQMVDDKILLQEAKKKKVRVNQRDLENGIMQVKARFLPEGGQKELQRIAQRQMAAAQSSAGSDPEEGLDLASAWKELGKSRPEDLKEAELRFQGELNKEGLSDAKFGERIRDQLSVVRLTNQEVRARGKTPTDEEAKALYEKLLLVMQGKDVKNADAEAVADLNSMAKFFAAKTSEQVRVRHILIQVPKEASFKEKSEAHQRLEKIRKKIADGADFAEMAEKNSDDKASVRDGRGGDLGYVARGQMVPTFEKAAFQLAVGQVSGITETEFGFHLLKVEEKKAASKLRFEDVENDLKEYLYRAGAQKAFESYLEELRKSASVKILVDVASPSEN